MADFGKNGMPTGTRIKIISAFDKSLIGKEHMIVMPLQWHVPLKRFVYGVDLPLAGCNTSWVEPHQIYLVSLPFSWQNYCYNKVTLLLAHAAEIQKELMLEQSRGDWK